MRQILTCYDYRLSHGEIATLFGGRRQSGLHRDGKDILSLFPTQSAARGAAGWEGDRESYCGVSALGEGLGAGIAGASAAGGATTGGGLTAPAAGAAGWIIGASCGVGGVAGAWTA